MSKTAIEEERVQPETIAGRVSFILGGEVRFETEPLDLRSYFLTVFWTPSAEDRRERYCRLPVLIMSDAPEAFADHIAEDVVYGLRNAERSGRVSR